MICKHFLLSYPVQMGADPDSDREAAFRRYRPFCSALAPGAHSTAALEQLSRLVADAAPEERCLLEDYLLFPMQLHLKNPGGAPGNYTIAVLDFIRQFYSGTRLGSGFVLTDVIENLLKIVGARDAQVSEDMKVAACSAVSAMLKGAPADVTAEKLYPESMRLPLGHLVSTALGWVSDESAPRNVVAAALDLVDRLCPSVTESAEAVAPFRRLFRPMYPGISTGLMRVLRDNRKRAGAARNKALAMRAWRRHTVAVMADGADSAVGEEEEGWLHRAQDHLLMQSRILAGLASASPSSGGADSELAPLRMELLKTVEALDASAPLNLANLRPSMIEITSILAVDSGNEKLAERSKRYTYYVRSKCTLWPCHLTFSPSSQVLEKTFASGGDKRGGEPAEWRSGISLAEGHRDERAGGNPPLVRSFEGGVSSRRDGRRDSV